jgi:hypothetical protein
MASNIRNKDDDKVDEIKSLRRVHCAAIHEKLMANLPCNEEE